MSVRWIRARNGAEDSENRIHSDEVAQRYGFRGGLVLGVSVYGYLMSGVEHAPGTVQLRLLKPVFDGDELEIRQDGSTITAIRAPNDVCASVEIGSAAFEVVDIPEHPLPAPESRPVASAETLMPGTVLGTIHQKLEPTRTSENVPGALLELANWALIRNYVLGPWLHAGSDVITHAAAQWGDDVAARARIQGRFEKKGREFVVVDLQIGGPRGLLQTIRHTAIYRLPGPGKTAH